MRHIAVILAVLIFTPAAANAATVNATPSTLSSVLSSAQGGDTILLAAGNYGTWAGTGKQVTLKAADGATATMKVNLGSGDAGFTLDGLSGMGGTIVSGAHDLTIRNSTFSSSLVIDGPVNANILIDSNRLTWAATWSSGGTPAKIHLSYGTGQHSGVTISNNVIANGNLDGIQAGEGVNVIGNEFHHLIDTGTNHTDPIQLIDAPDSIVRGNFLHDNTDGIVAFDGIVRPLIEDNVVLLQPDQDGVDLYAAVSPIVRHNTLLGDIFISHKSADPKSSGVQMYDNIVCRGIETTDSAVSRSDHNLTSCGAVAYVGPTSTWAGYKLAAGSAGAGSASDGLDVGIRTGGAPAPAPPADTTPPDTSITTAPVDGTATDATVTFTASETGSTFACRLDGGAWNSCISPRQYTGLTVGQHTVEVRATDLAGNTDPTPASVSWQVQAPPPPPDPCAQTRAQLEQAQADLAAMTDQRDQAAADLAAMTDNRDAWKQRALKAEDQLARIKAIAQE